MKKLLTLLTAGMFVLTAGNCVYAEDGADSWNQGFQKKHHEKRKEHMKQKQQEIKNRLNLTEDQKVKAKQLREQARPQIKTILDKKRALHQEIQQLRKSEVSKEALQAKYKTLESLRKQANKIREKNRQKFESILNSQQKAEFSKIKQEMKEKRELMKKNWKKQHKFKHHNED